MRSKIGILLLLCVYLLSNFAFASDDEAYYGIIQGGSLHMRTGPSQGDTITATYDGGTWVQILAEADNSFYQVITEDGREGYMMAGYILPDTLDAGDWGTVENGSRYVNLRSGPSENDSVIGHVSSGDRFDLLAYGNAYSMVRFDGTAVGYVASKLIRLDGETDWVQETTHTISGNSLNLHTAPSAGGAVIGSYPQGTEVIVLIAGTNWSKVFVEDSFGYMHTPSLAAHKTSSKGHTQSHATPAPVVQEQPPSYVDNPQMVMGPGPVNPFASGGDPQPFASHPRGGPQVTSYDFAPDDSFHDGTDGAAEASQLDG